MTPLVLLLAFAQAGLLLAAATLLANLGLRRHPSTSFFWGSALLAGAVTLTRVTLTLDPLRVLCSPADCLVLTLSVALVRMLVVSRESERVIEAHQLELRFAAEAAEAERRAFEEERIRAAEAAVEASRARVAQRQAQSQPDQRHLTPSMLRGGARSPRFPTAPRK